VTGGAADILNFQQEHILVAVDEQFLDQLGVARLLAFDPELVTRAAPVGGLT
jgi:hypothetical protein